MINNPLTFVATSDIAGISRGKAFSTKDMKKRLIKGVGWTPTNIQITCFDKIASSPFGSFGDLLLVPQEDTKVEIDFEDGKSKESFMLGNITTMEGEPWEHCTRNILNLALQRLKKSAGVSIFSAFEHEFQLKSTSANKSGAYSLKGFTQQRQLAEVLTSALQKANIQVDSFMKEYGSQQYEIVIEPTIGMKSADNAVILRELTRISATKCEEEATFSPIIDPKNVGNGVHIHMSFLNDDGTPATFDKDGIAGMSSLTGSFVAGILKYLDSIIAITAPSAISYLRLTPNRWSAAYNNLGFRDREASVRICPTSAKELEKKAKQFNFEFRAADATASPYLVMAAIIHAGTQGIEDKLPSPNFTEEDLSLLSHEELNKKGYTRLPQSLEEALQRFENNQTVRNWFPKGFDEIYLLHKKGELSCLDDLSDIQKCDKYKEVY